MNELWLIRHAETEWSASGRHTSRTEVPLTDAGRDAARRLVPALGGRNFAAVFTSPRERARETAALAGFPDARVEPALAEWDYGELEGITTNEIRARGGDWAGWTVFTGAVPGGESLEDVARRADGLCNRLEGIGGDVLCFGHGHMHRVIAAVMLGLGAGAGARLVLDPATINVVGRERDTRALTAWNVPASPLARPE